MTNQVKTVSFTFTRDQLTGTRNPQGNEILAGQVIFGKLRAAGVPVIGVLGILAVEWGEFTVKHDDGLDGDEWTYTYTGKLLDDYWIKEVGKLGNAPRLDRPLASRIAAKLAEDDEL